MSLKDAGSDRRAGPRVAVGARYGVALIARAGERAGRPDRRGNEGQP